MREVWPRRAEIGWLWQERCSSDWRLPNWQAWLRSFETAARKAAEWFAVGFETGSREWADC